MPTPSSTRRLLVQTAALAALLLAAPTATAQPCTAITDNVLTSAFCPKGCPEEFPCVLYSPTPSQTMDECEVTQAAGSCLWDDTFSVADETGAASTCNVTYQCLKSIVTDNKAWQLAIAPSPQRNQITTAGVTRIQQLEYPKDGVTTVEIIGGLGRNARGDVKAVKVDNSLFATPASVESFYLSDMNLRNALATVDFSTRKWTRVSLTNTNLLEVPAGLGKLPALNYLILNKNLISNITDATPFTKVTTLNLAYNELKDLTVALPAVVTLNLTGNPLSKIPDAIFDMKTLRTLAIRQTNLSNIALTDGQFTFLQQLTTLDADFVTTTCPNGTISQTFPSGAGSVCIPGSAPTTAPVETAKSSSNSTAIIVGIVAGVVVVALLAFFLCRKKKEPDNTVYTGTINKFGETTNGTTSTDNTGGTGIWGDPDLLAVRIEYRDIEPIKLLSRGGFGEVWLGLYMGENVAIKRLLSEKKTMDDALAFAAEVKIMARLDHPKVVRFIGVAWTSALTIQAVTEFMDCGDLRSLLDSSRAPSLTWANLKCQIAIDIADALVYLHTLNPKLIHRDLKSRNVLIDANTGAKLSDFGISRNRSVEETMTAGVGTSRWIAPEVIMGGHYTEFADIYSFGVVLSELDTAKSPFHDAVNTNGAKMPDVTILQLVSAGKLKPSFESNCPESIVKLAHACLSYDPAQRPSAIHISYELRKIMKDEL